jgi:peptidoglycan/LPS O-acetylase OafA/YrhL
VEDAAGVESPAGDGPRDDPCTGAVILMPFRTARGDSASSGVGQMRVALGEGPDGALGNGAKSLIVSVNGIALDGGLRCQLTVPRGLCRGHRHIFRNCGCASASLALKGLWSSSKLAYSVVSGIFFGLFRILAATDKDGQWKAVASIVITGASCDGCSLGASYMKEQNQQRPAERLEALTGIRFFAALAIVLLHLNGVLLIRAGTFDRAGFAYGVCLFFVLSGFVLHYSWRQKQDRLKWGRFMVGRIAKIWPAHLAVIALIVLIVGADEINWIRSTYSASQVASTLLLLQSWTYDIHTTFAINDPSWSLSNELFFYATFPLLSWLAIRSIALTILAVVFTSLMWTTYVSTMGPGVNLDAAIYAHPLARLYQFGVGIAACEIFFRTDFSLRRDNVIQIVAVAFCAVSVSTLAPVFASLVRHWPAFFVEVEGVFPTLAFAIMIFVMATGGGFIPNAILSNPIVVWLGETSFTLYLVHFPIIRYFKYNTNWTSYPVFIQLALFIGLIAFFMTAVHYLVEIPSTAFVKKMVNRREAEAGSGPLKNSLVTLGPGIKVQERVS